MFSCTRTRKHTTMRKIIVTSGQPFTDIDALACAVAYAELLKSEGKEAFAVLPGPLNKSVTKEIKKWRLNYLKKPPKGKAEYVLVDISDPEYFADFVILDNVIEVFDHRVGFRRYWKERLGKKSKIELVGACATLIWEEYKKIGLENKISETSANLLYTAIISNTLNFRASVTSSRDNKAFKEITRYNKLPQNWNEIFFKDQDAETDNNIESAVRNDLKNSKPFIAQLELWDAKKIIEKHKNTIIEIMKTYDPSDWFLTAPSIFEGKNYLLTLDENKKKLLEKAIDAKFEGDIGTTNKLWLRKEIIREFNKQ